MDTISTTETNPMNDTHKMCIANNMIDSLCVLLEGEVKFQKVYVPQGPGRPTKVCRRIIIEHESDADWI